MSKSTKWLIVAAVIFISLIVFLIVKHSRKVEADLSFPSTVLVKNISSFDKSEKVVKALAFNVLRMDTLEITISNMPKHMENAGDIQLQAYVKKHLWEDHIYNIYLNRTVNEVHLMKILSHEMIHVRQMEEGDLVQFSPDNPVAIWKGDTIDYHEVEYAKRPHEIEASKYDDKVLKDLLDIWYE